MAAVGFTDQDRRTLADTRTAVASVLATQASDRVDGAEALLRLEGVVREETQAVAATVGEVGRALDERLGDLASATENQGRLLGIVASDVLASAKTVGTVAERVAVIREDQHEHESRLYRIEQDVHAILARLPGAGAARLAEVVAAAEQWWAADEQHFRQVASNAKPTGDPNVTGAYMTSYPVEACVNLYRATGENAWLGRATALIDASLAQLVVRDGISVWVRPSGQWQWWEQAHALRAYVDAVPDDAPLVLGAEETFRSLLARPGGDQPSVREWCLWRASSGLYEGPVQQAARMALALARAGRSVDEWQAFADELHERFSTACVWVPGGRLVYKTPGADDAAPVYFDTGHAGRVAAWLVEQESALVTCAVASLLEIVGDAEPLSFAYRIDGSGPRTGTVWDGWPALATVTDQSLALVGRIFDTIRDGSGTQHFRDTHGTTHARLSVAAWLARGLR